MQHRKCYYCNVVLVQYHTNRNTRVAPRNGLTRDHLLPKDRGGKCLPNNQVYCCCDCNIDKARLTLEEYRVVRAFRAGMIAISNFQFPGEHK